VKINFIHLKYFLGLLGMYFIGSHLFWYLLLDHRNTSLSGSKLFRSGSPTEDIKQVREFTLKKMNEVGRGSQELSERTQ